jgi:hypothetical protein
VKDGKNQRIAKQETKIKQTASFPSLLGSEALLRNAVDFQQTTSRHFPEDRTP